MDPGVEPSDKLVQSRASPRLFRNALLDRLSRVHHSMPLLIYGPLILVLLLVTARSVRAFPALLALAAGYVVWTLVEYLGHRFLFHYRPATKLGIRLQYLIHGVHHDHPGDGTRLVMPPLMSLPIIGAAGALFRGLCGPAVFAPGLAGFAAGYLAYDMLHFHIHHRSPKSSLGRLLRQRHMYHHFRDDLCWYGVSAPWWDTVFGTRARPVASRRETTGANSRSV